jgi:alpha-glucosidase
MMRRLTDEYDQRVLIGEIYLPIGQLVAYYGTDGSGAHLPFNFQLVVLPWDPMRINAAILEYEGELPPDGWPNWVLGNHDKHRIASRIGPGQARVAAMLLLTLRGTPTMYYGDEIGMHDVEIPPDMVQDPQEKNVPGKGLGRDPERTPMQWDQTENAGFTTGNPWLPIADDFGSRNIRVQKDDAGSILSLYRRLIDLRQSQRSLCAGRYIPVQDNPNVISYVREVTGHRRFLVALNLTHEPQEQVLKEYAGRIALTTGLNREGEEVTRRIALAADEGAIVELAD